MSLQPADRKNLLIAASVALAAVVIIAVATTFLVRGTSHSDPKISVASGGHYERIEPSFFCDVKMEECHPRHLSEQEIAGLTPASFPVETGKSLTLSVPSEIASGPWLLTAVYATPAGIEPVQWWHESDTMRTQVLESTEQRTLLGLEIRPLSAVVIDVDAPGGVESGQGEWLFRANYSVSTAPEDYPGPPSQTELPLRRG